LTAGDPESRVKFLFFGSENNGSAYKPNPNKKDADNKLKINSFFMMDLF
jgi:hypothetical protein